MFSQETIHGHDDHGFRARTVTQTDNKVPGRVSAIATIMAGCG